MAQDSITTDIAASAQDRTAERRKLLESRLDALIDEENAPPKPPANPVPVGLKAPLPKDPTVWKETTRAIGGGIRDAAQNTLDLAHDAGTWLGENLLGLRMATGPSSRINLPKVAENQTTVGKIGRSLTQFVVPFMGATKFLKATTSLGTVTRSMAAGAATDAAAFDPHEKRLSNMVMEMSDNEPVFGKAAFEYLAADPNDSNAEGRFKNAVEGLGLGVAVEGLFKGLRVVKNHYWTKGQDPEDSIKKAAEASKKEAEEATKQAQANRTNEVLDLVEKTKQEAKAMPLRDQIDVLTGVKRSSPKKTAEDMEAALKEREGAEVNKRVDEVTGVSRQSDSAQKRADVEAAVAEETPTERFNRVTASVSSGKSHRAVWSDQEGSIVFTKEPPKPGELPLDQRIKTSLAKPAHERTAQDLVVLRAYRQLQEAAHKNIVKVGDEVPKATNGQPLEVVTSRARKGEASKGEAPKAEAATGPKEGDTVFYGSGKESGVLVKTLPNGKVVVKDDRTGATKTVTPDEPDELVDEIRKRDLEIVRNVGQKQNAMGLTDPAVLAQLAAPAGGAVAGATSGDEDDDFATMLTLAGVGALAAYGIKVKVGKSKVLTPAQREVATNPDPVVQSLARKEVSNIAPVDPNLVTKKVPVIPSAKVTKMVDLAVSGDYKTVAKSLKESDFNFDHIDTPEDVKAMVDSFSSVFEKEASKAKHGTQTFKQMEELAQELGAGKETMKKMYEGTDNLASRVLAHRSLLAASAEKVTDLAKLAMKGDADAILALRKHVALHASIQSQMKGVQTEIARALGQFRITASSVDLAVNERNQLIEAMGGHKANIEFATKLASISDPTKLNAVIRKGAMARTHDAFFEAWINGLLSGPATHVVNMVGNSLTALNSVAERGTASMIGKVLRNPQGVELGEAKAQLFGMVEGLKDAVSITSEGLAAIRSSAAQVAKGDLKGAGETITGNLDEFGGMWKAGITDSPVLDSAAFGTREMHPPAITAQNFDQDPNSILGGFADALGSLVRLPGRALTTSDELFKTIHYRGELKSQAYRIARSEGLEGEALFKRIADLLDDPTPALQAQAIQAARSGTFTTPLGSQGASLQNLILNIPGGRYVMPFVRTPINLMKFVGVRTPGLNLLAESVRNEFKAGGVRRDIMLAKTAMGGSMYALGAHLSAEGVINGGGEENQSAERIGGIQPYSVKVGNTYYAYNRFDPFGAFLGLAADLTDISGHISQDEMGDAASAALLALSRNLTSKTYLSGLVELIDVISSNSEAKMEKWIQRQAGTFLPFSSGLAAVRREVDPEVKEVWTLVDAIKARVPGYSKDVPPLVNIFGEDVHYKGGLGPDIASPVYTSEASSEPAAAEIARLNLDLEHPAKTLAAGGGPGIDLSPKQYYRYMKLIGGGRDGNSGFKQALTKLVQSDQYKALPEDGASGDYLSAKEKVIKLMYSNYKRQAEALLIHGDPQLKQAYELNYKNVGNALGGRPLFMVPTQQ